MTESISPVRHDHAGRKPGWSKMLKVVVPLGMSLAVAALLLSLAGVFHPKVPQPSGMRGAARFAGGSTAVARIVRRTRYEQASGTIKPVHEVSLASKILARVIEVKVKAGDHVADGDLLVQLDDGDLRSRLRQAEESVNGATARREQAAADFERAQSLHEKRAISQAEYDQAKASLSTASADWEKASQSVLEARIVLEYAALRSPIAGTVVEKRVESGDTVSPGQVLVTLYDPTRMQMVASVRESLALRLAVGQTLPARLESLGYECEAAVSEIVPEAQASSRSFTVKVTGPCPPGIYPGMFGRLLLPLDDEEILVIPGNAVRRVGQLTMVDCVVDGRIHRRNVQLGRTLDADVEVLSGLSAGETVLAGNGVTGGESDAAR